jgi:hypothetical protein
VFKLDMGTVLFSHKPAIITQKFQNFSNRHSISIRIFYTYVKRSLLVSITRPTRWRSTRQLA